jgi:hypothetical protein
VYISHASRSSNHRLIPSLAAAMVLLFGCSSAATRVPTSTTSINHFSGTIREYASLFALAANPDEIKAVTLIARDIGAITSVVKKDFYTFHYAPGIQVNVTQTAPHSDDPSAFPLFKAKIDRFVVDKDYGNIRGNGLYAATDPTATYDYGQGQNFLLLQVRLRAGLRILESEKLNSAIQADTRAALATVGCSASDYYGFVDNRNCGKFLKLAMLAINVTAIEYNYSYSGPVLQCESAQSAFVIIDSDFFQGNDVQLLMGNSNLSDPKTRAAIHDVFAMYVAKSSQNYCNTWKTAFANETFEVQGDKWDKFLADRLAKCPAEKDHIAEEKITPPNEASLTVVGTRLEANAKITLLGTYLGRPLISITSVKSKVANSPDFVDATNALSRLKGFCDGSPSCSYLAQYLGSANSPLTYQIEWQCLKGDENPENRSTKIDMTNRTTVDFDCAVVPSPKSEEKTKRKKNRN